MKFIATELHSVVLQRSDFFSQSDYSSYRLFANFLSVDLIVWSIGRRRRRRRVILSRNSRSCGKRNETLAKMVGAFSWQSHRIESTNFVISLSATRILCTLIYLLKTLGEKKQGSTCRLHCSGIEFQAPTSPAPTTNISYEIGKRAKRQFTRKIE